MFGTTQDPKTNGAKGGATRTEAKAAAARSNGAQGGRRRGGVRISVAQHEENVRAKAEGRHPVRVDEIRCKTCAPIVLTATQKEETK